MSTSHIYHTQGIRDLPTVNTDKAIWGGNYRLSWRSEIIIILSDHIKH